MVVHTVFVEPFNPIIGAQYIVLGELENVEGKERFSDLVLLGNVELFIWIFLDPHISQTFKYLQDFCLYRLPLSVSSHLTGVGLTVRARVLNCVDGVNIALLQKAINEQRSFFREREQKQGDAAQPAHDT